MTKALLSPARHPTRTWWIMDDADNNLTPHNLQRIADRWPRQACDTTSNPSNATQLDDKARLLKSGGRTRPISPRTNRSRLRVATAQSVICAYPAAGASCQRRLLAAEEAVSKGYQAITTSATSSLPFVSGPSEIAMAKLIAAAIVPTSIGTTYPRPSPVAQYANIGAVKPPHTAPW